MGKRGPKPKPSALRVFEGDPGRLLKDGAEPVPELAANLTAPEWLVALGRAKWEELAPKLAAIRLLTNIDLDRLALYCEACQEFHDARALVAADGLVAVSEKGGVYQHPAVGIKNNAITRMRQLGNDLGLSPASRVGLNVDSGAGSDGELDKFKAGG